MANPWIITFTFLKPPDTRWQTGREEYPSEDDANVMYSRMTGEYRRYYCHVSLPYQEQDNG